MNKIGYILLLIGCLAGFTACEEDCDETHINNLAHFPNVLKGSFPTEAQVLEIGEEITIDPALVDSTNARFSWVVNGTEVSTDTTFTYKIEKPCHAQIVCTIQNPYGSVEMKTTVSSKHDFSKGFFYVANGTFNFYDTEKEAAYENCYGSLNAEAKFSDKSLEVAAANGKFYVLSKSSASNVEHFYVLDAQTLSYENSTTIDSNLSGLTILNANYGLVSGDGVRRIDLQSLSTTQLLDDYMFGLYNSLVYGENLLTSTTYGAGESAKVTYYKVAQLLDAPKNKMPESKELDIMQNRKSNFVTAKDGNCYTLESSDAGYSIVKITQNLSIEKTTLGFEPSKNKYWSDKTIGIVASKSENAIYISAVSGDIYKYVPGNPASLQAPFIAAGELKGVVSTLQVNSQTEELYVSYNTGIGVYSKDGKMEYLVKCSNPSYVLFN